MQIFIISLSSAIGRRQFQAKQLSKLELNYEILGATSIHDISNKTYAKHNKDWQRPLKNTEVACYFSHRTAWQKIIENNLPALILEDDAVLSKHTPKILNSINDFTDIDLVQLEVRGRKKLIKNEGRSILRSHILYRLYQDRTGAAGYVLWPSGAKKLIEHEGLHGIGLADAHIASCYSIKSYQVEPAAIIQLDQCHDYNVKNSYAKSLSSSSVSSHIKNRNGPFYFRIKRITAQLKLGLHVAKMLKRKSSMRFINISSDDFME
jgi:glycosyl transferase, family 25